MWSEMDALARWASSLWATERSAVENTGEKSRLRLTVSRRRAPLESNRQVKESRCKQKGHDDGSHLASKW